MEFPASLYARRHSEPVGALLTSPNPDHLISSPRDPSVSPSIRSKHLLSDLDSARANAESTLMASSPPTLTGSRSRLSSDFSDTPNIRPVCPESPSARDRRSPTENDTPPMNVHSTSVEHTLDVWLPKELSPEMVTVSAKKGNKLSIVADVWFREANSHYEWDIVFPPRDVDMSSIRVSLSEGHVTIRARRTLRQSQFC